MGVRGTMMRLGLTLVGLRCMTPGCLCLTVLLTVYFVLLGIQVCFVLGLIGWRLHYSSWPDFSWYWLGWFENYHTCHTCDNSNKSDEIFDLLIIQFSAQVFERSPGRELSQWWFCLILFIYLSNNTLNYYYNAAIMHASVIRIVFLLVWSCKTWTVHDQFHYCRMILVYWRFQECSGLSIDLSWSFVSSLLWVIVSLIDTHFYQRRKLNPYNTCEAS